MANDPGYSPPWATPGPGGPVDPGYSPPWAQAPGGGGKPVDPGYSPPWAQVPGGGGVVPPLGFWGPNDPRPTPPIYIPIVIPPDPANPDAPHIEHPIYLPVYPSHPIYFPPGTKPEEVAKKLVEFVNFWTGNLPTDPDAPNVPTPV